eukprot:scaffold196239_cov31-Tisochrysis_lutea.AAC.2
MEEHQDMLRDRRVDHVSERGRRRRLNEREREKSGGKKKKGERRGRNPLSLSLSLTLSSHRTSMQDALREHQRRAPSDR